MKRISIFLVCICCWITAFSSEPTLIVTENGETIKGYNIEITPTSVYYSISESPEAEIKKLAKSDVMIIRMPDGSKIVMSEMVDSQPSNILLDKQTIREPIIYTALEDDFVEYQRPEYKWVGNFADRRKVKKNGKITPERNILVSNGANQILTMRLLSESDKTVAVTMPRDVVIEKKGKSELTAVQYDESEYILPEYIKVGKDKYKVVEIGDWSFCCSKNVRNVIFPNTIKVIGHRAFLGTSLERIALPEGLEIIGERAFASIGLRKWPFQLEYVYIPKSVKEIGVFAFLGSGAKTSYKGYFQGQLTSLPDWVGTGNCIQYGIDEEAVEEYRNRTK